MSQSSIVDGKHIMLLCQNEKLRNEAAAQFINRGLDREDLCIYASVDAFSENSYTSVSKLAPKIKDFQNNCNKNNLQIVDFKPYYEAALLGDLVLFKLLKQKLEKMLCDRIAQGKTDKITVFADAACCLSDNKKYLESEVLERWWQLTHDEWERNGQHITVICPHPVNFDNEVAKHKVAQRHDATIEFDFDARKNIMQVLIAEPELDLRILYSEYFRYLGLDITVVDNGRKCLSLIREKGFDFVILDTHLQDIPAMQLIPQIRSFVPNQRIILTTTHSPDQIIIALESIGIGKENILSKPFELSRLFEALQKIT